MRVMVIVKSNPETEAQSTSAADMEKMFTEMGNYNEELVKAGVMLAGEGLLPSSTGKRIRFSGTKRSVVDGPFAEAKELVAGYWIWRVASMDEAVEWAKRCPNPMPGEEGVLEIRPTYSTDEFNELLTDEIRERFDRTGKEMERQQKSKPRSKKKVTRKKQKAKRAKSKK